MLGFTIAITVAAMLLGFVALITQSIACLIQCSVLHSKLF